MATDQFENAEALPMGGGMPVTILAQYVKDLSFENPNAPETLRQSDGRPMMDANFSMEAKPVEWEGRKHIYEMTLGLKTAAQRDGKTAFLCEIQYGVLCDLSDLPEEHHHPMLLIEMPRYAFPFVRQIVADLTQQAGYAPLLLAPADFRSFYMQRFGGGQAAA